MGTGYLHRRSRQVLARSSRSQDPSVPVARPHRASPSSPILSERCTCGERKSRHYMAGFAKGMATTSGWTLVRCDCRNRIHQVARARQRWRRQPVHGGCDVKDRMASIAHDADDRNSFSPFVDAAARRTIDLQRGCRASLRHSSSKSTTRQHVCQTSRPDRQLPDPKGRGECVWMCHLDSCHIRYRRSPTM
jgi:hypothetical protein